MKRKLQAGFSTGLVAVIIIVLVIIGAVVYSNSKPKPNETMEKKSDAMMEDKTVEESSMRVACSSDRPACPDGEDITCSNGKWVCIGPASPGKMSEGDKMMEQEKDSMMKSETKTFNITGHNFAFSSSEIRVKKGDTAKINFESTGGFHDFSVDGYNVKTQQVNPGTPTSVEFVADKAGTFEFFCSVGSHRAMGMSGKLIVE